MRNTSPIPVSWDDFFSFFTVPIGKMFIPQSCEAQDLELDGGTHLCTQTSVLDLLGINTDLWAELPTVLVWGDHIL